MSRSNHTTQRFVITITLFILQALHHYVRKIKDVPLAIFSCDNNQVMVLAITKQDNRFSFEYVLDRGMDILVS